MKLMKIKALEDNFHTWVSISH